MLPTVNVETALRVHFLGTSREHFLFISTAVAVLSFVIMDGIFLGTSGNICKPVMRTVLVGVEWGGGTNCSVL